MIEAGIAAFEYGEKQSAMLDEIRKLPRTIETLDFTKQEVKINSPGVEYGIPSRYELMEQAGELPREISDLSEISDFKCIADFKLIGPEANSEKKDYSFDEINAMQISAIKESFEKLFRGEKLTSEQLGNLGEMMMDQFYIASGFTPLNLHRVMGMDDKKEGFRTGIDGVYERTNPDGSKKYVIADAKYNTSQLADTNDGKQMSANWIDKRLDDGVGKEKADEIRNAFEDDPESVRHEVYHIDPNQDEDSFIHTDIQAVDSNGNKVGDKQLVEYYDENGNRITNKTMRAII